MQQLTIIFLGTQGSGKGTQISLLKEFLQRESDGRAVVHFEMGKTLRDRGEKDDFTGHQTREILRGGNLIPYVISASLFALYLMDNIKTGEENLIIDGFPRTADQVPTLHSAMQFFKRARTDVVCINISDDEAVTRLVKRGRSDDTEEGIRKRLEWSRQQTMPNIKWFRADPSYRVIDIDGERSIEDIHADILQQLGVQRP